MTDTQAPTFKNIGRFDGVCRECGSDTGAMRTLEPSGGTKGIYVRCECDQINRCYK